MRLSNERMNSLKAILIGIGLNYNDDQLQDAGIAIMRFLLVKSQDISLENNENEDKDETNATKTK